LKIYFDGCSYTKGSNRWGVDNWEERRWSKLLANKLGAEEYNFSSGGGSNPRILRNITTQHNISDYDLAVILMTRPNRTEYFYNGNFRHVLPTKKFESNPEIAQFWNFYYKTIYDEQYGDTYEEIIQKSIKAICATNNVPLVLMSNRVRTKLSYDLIISCDKYGSISSTDKHPSLDAQPKIADDIYNFINKYKRFY
tara:strand:- start:20 stop:607 length:588 start_codon:yes stop_codon:yes gene_type:complete